jgi:hypothetical protein
VVHRYSLTGHTHVDTNTDDYLTGHTFNTTTGLLTSTLQSGSTVSVNLDGRYLNVTASTANSNDYLTGGTFNTGTGELDLVLQSGSTVTIDLDGRYLTGGTGTADQIAYFSSTNELTSSGDMTRTGSLIKLNVAEIDNATLELVLSGDSILHGKTIAKVISDLTVEFGSASVTDVTIDTVTRQVAFNAYGSENFVGTQAYLLGVTSAGAIIETDPTIYSLTGHTHAFSDLSSTGHTHSEYLLNTTDTLTGVLTVTSNVNVGGNVGLNLGNKITFDTDLDEFAFIFADTSNTLGFGINEMILASPSTDDDFHFIEGETSAYVDAYANAFVTDGGTSSDFVKGDGSLDSNSYSLTGHTHAFSGLTSTGHTHSEYLLNTTDTFTGLLTLTGNIHAEETVGDPDGTSWTNYNAYHRFSTNISNGDYTVGIINGGNTNHDGILVLGHENAAASTWNHLKMVADTNGTPIEQFTFRGDGRLGIGVTAPLTNLEVYQDDAPSIITIKGGLNAQTTLGNEIGSLDFRSNDPSIVSTNDIAGRIVSVAEFSNGALAGLAFYTADNTTSPYINERMRINNLGNVGIGDTNPAEKLVISGTTSEDPYILVRHNGGSVGHAGIKLSSAGSGGREYSITSGDATYGSGSGLHFEEADGLSVTMLAAGEVGIGITTPDGTLHVHTASAGAVTANTSADDFVVENSSDAGINILSPDASLSTLRFGSPSDNAGAQLAWRYTDLLYTIGTAAAGGEIQFNTANSVMAGYIASDGDWGIGTATPQTRLDVEDDGTLAANINVLSLTAEVATAPSIDTTVGMNFSLQQATNTPIAYASIQAGEHQGTGSIKGSLRFLVQNYDGGESMEEKMRIISTGAINFGDYGDGSISGTPVYNLAVDASGNVVQNSLSSGGSGLYLPLSGGTMTGDITMTSSDIIVNNGDILTNGANASNGRIWSDYQEISVSGGTAEGWYKLLELGGGIRRFTLRIQATGDNSNSIDEFEINTSGFNFQHHITNLSGSRFNTSKLLEIRTDNPSAGGTSQVWVRIGAFTVTDEVHFYTTYGTFEAPIELGSEPTWGGNNAQLLFDSFLRQDYSIDTTAGIRATKALFNTTDAWNIAPLTIGSDDGNEPSVEFKSGSGSFAISVNDAAVDFLSVVHTTGAATFIEDVLVTGQLGVGISAAAGTRAHFLMASGEDVRIDAPTGVSPELYLRNAVNDTEAIITYTTAGLQFKNSSAVDTVNFDSIGNITANGSFINPQSTDGVYYKDNVSSQSGALLYPDGGWFRGTGTSQTGALKIALPVAVSSGASSNFLSFEINVFEYTTNESFKVYVHGYNYQGIGGTEWLNCTATIIGSLSDRDFAVRFGDDGTRKCIWIGETGTTFSYPTIQVSNVYAGFSGGVEDYGDDWVITAEETSFGTVAFTITDVLPAASSSVTLSGLTSGQFIRSDVDDQKTGGDTIFNDGTQLHLGTDSDMRMYYGGGVNYFDLYDGNLVIRESGTTRVTITKANGDITTTGDLRMSENATYLHADNSSGAATRIHGINAGNIEYVGSIDADTAALFLGTTADYISIRTNSSERMRVNDTATYIYGDTSGDPGHLELWDGDSVRKLVLMSSYAGIGQSKIDTIAGDLQLAADGVVAMHIETSGSKYIGLGTGATTPQATVHIREGAGVETQLKIEGGNTNVTAVGEINASLLFGSNDASVNGSGEGANNVAGKIASITEATNGALVGLGFYTYNQGEVDQSQELKEHVRISWDGNLGIGTQDPDYKIESVTLGDNFGLSLRLSGTSATIDEFSGIRFSQRAADDYSGSIRHVNTASSPSFLNPRMDFHTQDNNTNADVDSTVKMTILGSGNLGINEIDPVTLLDIKGNVNAVGLQRVMKLEAYGVNDDDGAFINFSTSSADGYGPQIGGIREASGGLGAFFVNTGANAQTERMRIADNGYVGIGTASATTIVHINDDAATGTGLLVTGGGSGGALATFTRDIGATGSTVEINANADTPQIKISNATLNYIMGVDGNNKFKIVDGETLSTGTDRFVIDGDGNVGIDITSPLAQMHINDDATTGTGLLITGGGGSGKLASFVRDVGFTGASINIHADNVDPSIHLQKDSTDYVIGIGKTYNFRISSASGLTSNISYPVDKFTIDTNGALGGIDGFRKNIDYDSVSATTSASTSIYEIDGATDFSKVLVITGGTSTGTTIISLLSGGLNYDGEMVEIDFQGEGLCLISATTASLRHNSNVTLYADGKYSRVGIQKMRDDVYRVFGELSGGTAAVHAMSAGTDTCSGTTGVTYYISGGNDIPHNGEIVYTDAGGTTVLVGGGTTYYEGYGGYFFDVDNNGVISNRGFCTPP